MLTALLPTIGNDDDDGDVAGDADDEKNNGAELILGDENCSSEGDSVLSSNKSTYTRMYVCMCTY